MTVGELLHHTVARLSAPELLSEDPQQEARELVAYALNILPAELPPRLAATVEAVQHGEFMRLLSRRLNAEPTGYLVGAVELLGLRFKVDRRVPRDATGYALDLACGIGAAGIAVAHARPGLRVDLADMSSEAIELARENAERLIPGRAGCYAGDLFQPLPRGRKYAIVTANPPWVPDGTELPEEVINHEPVASFFGGPDGLDVVRRLVRELPEWLAFRGVYAQECDPSQVEKVIGLLLGAGLREPCAHADVSGVHRVVSAQKL